MFFISMLSLATGICILNNITTGKLKNISRIYKEIRSLITTLQIVFQMIQNMCFTQSRGFISRGIHRPVMLSKPLTLK